MLRAALVRDVLAVLSRKSYFETNDFLLSESTPKNSTKVQINLRYRHDDAYYFNADIPSQKSKKDEFGTAYLIEGSVCPGEMAYAEKIGVYDKDGLLSAIHDWTVRLHDELSAIPANRQIEEQKRQLEEMLKNFEQLPDEFFSQDEAQQLRQKLDELEKKLVHNIEQTVKDKQELSMKVDAIKADISALKNNLDTHKKKTWVGSLSVRFLNWIKDPTNRQLLKSGVELANNLLTEGKK